MTLARQILTVGAALALGAVGPAFAQDAPRGQKPERKFSVAGAQVSREEYRSALADRVWEAFNPQYDEGGSSDSPGEWGDKARELWTEERSIPFPLPGAGIPSELRLKAYDREVLGEVLVEYVSTQTRAGRPLHALEVLNAIGHAAPEKVIDPALEQLLATDARLEYQPATDIIRYWTDIKGRGDLTKGATAGQVGTVTVRLADSGYVTYALNFRTLLQEQFKQVPAAVDDALVRRARWTALVGSPLEAKQLLTAIGHAAPEKVIDPALDERFAGGEVNPRFARDLLAYWKERGAGDITRGTTAERLAALAEPSAREGYVTEAVQMYAFIRDAFKADPSGLHPGFARAAENLARLRDFHDAYRLLETISHPSPDGIIGPAVDRTLGELSHAHARTVQSITDYWKARGNGDIAKATAPSKALKLALHCRDRGFIETALELYVGLRDDFKGRLDTGLPGPLGTVTLPLDLKQFEFHFEQYAKNQVGWSRPDQAYPVFVALGRPDPAQSVDDLLAPLLKDPDRINIWNASHIIEYWRDQKGKGDLSRGARLEDVMAIVHAYLGSHRRELAGPLCKQVYAAYAGVPERERQATIFDALYRHTFAQQAQQELDFRALIWACDRAELTMVEADIPLPPLALRERSIRTRFEERLPRAKSIAPEAALEDLKDALRFRHEFYLVRAYMDATGVLPKPEWLADYGRRCLNRAEPAYGDGMAALALAVRLAKDPAVLLPRADTWAYDALWKGTDASLEDTLDVLDALKLTIKDDRLSHAVEKRLGQGDITNAAIVAAALTDLELRREHVRDAYRAWSALDAGPRREHAIAFLPALVRRNPDMLLYFAHHAVDDGLSDVASAAYRLALHAAPNDLKKTAYRIGNDETAELTCKEYLQALVNLSERRPWNQYDEGAGEKNGLWKAVQAEYQRRK
jgi:hypothetical protein